MILLLAGLVGSGKTSLAKEVSIKLGIPHVDIDKFKQEIYPTDPDYERNIREGIPFSPETRTRVFERTVQEFAKLASEGNQWLVADETFHKKGLRDIVFEGANRYSGGYLLVHVKVPEEVTRSRLLRGRKDHILGSQAWEMYLGMKRQFDPFTESHLYFDNSKPLDESAQELLGLLKERGF